MKANRLVITLGINHFDRLSNRPSQGEGFNNLKANGPNMTPAASTPNAASQACGS
jgi:hypothetical protein